MQQSFASLGPQGRWRRVVIMAAVPISFIILILAFGSSYVPESKFGASSQYPVQSSNVSIDDTNMSMATVIKALYTPILHPVDAPTFTDEDGDTYHLPAGEPRFKQKLGKKVLILDIDSRPLTGEGQLMNKDLKWKGMRALSAGMLSHYMFAMIHGYDYKFIRAPDYEDRWGTWVKVPMMKEALKTHDYIVFMDSDVMFHYPHLPLEWLLNYWNMTKDTLAMMSIDPDEPQNYDAKGNRYLNTGFVIAQKSQRTQEMYKAWAECPTENKYKGCSRWKLDWAHEQAAFGNYLRYDYDRPEDIKVLPCVEANGAPEAEHRGGCKGIFVRHYWINKGLLAKSMADSVMQYFVPRLHQLYLQSANEHIENMKDYRISNAELIPLTEEEKATAKKGKNQKDEGW
ncbi:hypothetical protein BU24DRAFT_430725 [Aaosphaeria arxii CBS 175.79]|uniref:Nucleotide-diphospho-sugar transferase domain-containing protein n=1 Tax=Aaosphaeria arxii CBS 175.79 TaxID=1450172 RepID=A0A6A5YCS6_9PLEO|nr:uncharacterized protein BU24DRAFT_430725 [Aaosphaeria arxii CBS 175.79]KAF2022391.1 hypothetical protein BU24DRAFT_430725 [Aaosphaeria arxii CBS 175.79]